MSGTPNLEILNVDDVFEIYERVAGTFACLCALQQWAKIETLDPSAFEPLIAALMPVRDRLAPLVEAMKEAHGS